METSFALVPYCGFAFLRSTKDRDKREGKNLCVEEWIRFPLLSPSPSPTTLPLSIIGSIHQIKNLTTPQNSIFSPSRLLFLRCHIVSHHRHINSEGFAVNMNEKAFVSKELHAKHTKVPLFKWFFSQEFNLTKITLSSTNF